MKMRVAVIDGIAAHYRLSLFQKLSLLDEPEYTIYASEKPVQGIKTIDPDLASKPVSLGGIRWKFLSNFVIKGRIIWQKNVFALSATGSYDIYIFIGEAHALSTWVGVLLCRIRKKKIVFWGHGLYGNESLLKKVVRRLFNSLPDAYLVYDQRAALLLSEAGFDHRKIFVLFNSLNHSVHLEIRKSITPGELIDFKRKLFPSSYDLHTLLFIGRLVPGKKIEQLISSVKILHENNLKINLLIIGAGDNEDSLRDQVHLADLDDFVVFSGECYDEKKNGILISLSDCCVSPGNVGLTAIHCMTFGTPVISHSDLKNQGPEVSAILENLTGELFEKDDLNAMVKKIRKVVFEKGKNFYSQNCIEIIEKFYNPDYQVDVFKEMTSKVLSD